MFNTKNFLAAVFSLVFSFLFLALSIVGFAWLASNRINNASNISVKIDVPFEVTLINYYHQKETNDYISSSGTDVSLQAYDSIFTEYNVDLDRVLELEISRIPEGINVLDFVLHRVSHNDTSISRLNYYSSSIVNVSFYISTTKQSTAELIWTTAVENATGNYVFTTKTGNTYTKVDQIEITHILTQAEQEVSTLYVYLIFNYSETLIDEYIQQYDIFDSELGDFGAAVSFENDFGVLEVNLS